MKYAFIVAILLATSGPLVAAPADIEKARQAFLESDFETAREAFTACAQLGHPDAQFNLAAMYYNGNGGSRNPALAFAWFLLAAENGVADARAPLTQLQTQVTAQDKALVGDIVGKYRKATLQRDLLPSLGAGSQQTTSPRPVLDWPSGLREFAFFDGAERDPLAAGGLVLKTTEFRSVTMDIVIAPDGSVRDVEEVLSVPSGLFGKELFRYASRIRYEPASQASQGRDVNRVTLFVPGPRTHPDNARKGLRELHEKYAQCATEGNVQCQYIESLLGAARQQVERELSEQQPATAHGGNLLLAAQGGHAWAQYYIGRNLMYGAGADAGKARKWLEMAHAKGVHRAAVMLARLELNAAPGDPSSWNRASKLLKAAVEEKEPMAQLPLAALQAAAPIAEVRDPKGAANLVERLRFRRSTDPCVPEILAAVAAARGDYKGAVKQQQEAIERAAELHWKLDGLHERLAKYQAGEPWNGDLLAW